MTHSNQFSNCATINDVACQKIAWSKTKTSDALIDYSFALSQTFWCGKFPTATSPDDIEVYYKNYKDCQ